MLRTILLGGIFFGLEKVSRFACLNRFMYSAIDVKQAKHIEGFCLGKNIWYLEKCHKFYTWNNFIDSDIGFKRVKFLE